MNWRRPLALVLLALSAASAPAGAQTGDAAAASGAVSAAYAKDLRTIMEGMRTFENVSSVKPNSAALPQGDREFDVAFRRQMTREDVYRHLQPAFARVLSAKRAADVAQLMSSPVVRKREARAMVAPNNVSYGSSYFTAAEAAELRRIDFSPAMVEWRALQPKLGADVYKAMTTWAIQFGDQMAERARNVLRKVSADLAAAREPGQARTITVGRVGLPYLDQIVWAVGSSLIRINNAARRFEDELAHLGFADVLKPEYLASRVSLAHSRNVVEGAEIALEALLKDVNGAVKDREDAMHAVEFSNKDEYVKSINRSLGNAYAFYVDFGEANRRVLDQYRRALAFFEERQQKIQFKDGNLTFSSDADMVMAREIFSNVELAKAKLRSVVEEQTKRESALMNKAGSTGSQPGAD